MKANKVTVTIIVECLHLDCVGGLLSEVALRLDEANISGHLEKDDGDNANWATTQVPVEF
jgi:hypothetical protein